MTSPDENNKDSDSPESKFKFPWVPADGYLTIPIRTHEYITERTSSRLYRVLNVVDKSFLILFTLIAIGLVAISLMFAIILLDNLHVIHVMQEQTVPGKIMSTSVPQPSPFE